MQETTLPPARKAPAARRPWPLATTVVLVAALALGAVQLDAWYGARLRAEEQARMEAVLTGRASSLELAVTRYATVLDGLAAWMRERPDATSEAFRSFASTLHALTPGTQALQRVQGDRIQDTYPLEGNQAALGLVLTELPDTAVAAGLRRAWATEDATVTGPLELVQGGSGIILRRVAVSTAPSGPLSAAVVVRVDQLMYDAGLSAVDPAIQIAVEDGNGRRVGGGIVPDSLGPVRVAVSLPEGRWTLSAVPVGGWDHAVAEAVRVERLALTAVVVLLGLLTYGVLAHEFRLAHVVASRTAELSDANLRLAQSAEALEDRRALLDAAMTAGRTHVWSWDPRSDELRRWGATLYGDGATVPDTVDRVLDRTHPDDRDRLAGAFDAARMSGVVELECRVDLGSGDYAWLRIQGQATEHDDRGRPTEVLGATVDITKMKELEAELLHRGRLEIIGQLAGGVVHDVNSALAVVQGELEMTQVDPDEYPVERAIRESVAATQYASALLGQLLTFSRKDRAEPTTFLWDDVCTDAAGFLGRLLGAGVEVKLDLQAPGARVYMDRSQGMQVLANLATNARDAMAGSGTFSISTRVAEDAAGAGGGRLLTEVSDTGGGIPLEARDRVFEAFFTTKGKTSGTGLGLSTTQRVVQEAGGEITFRTSTEGTTFTVALPLAEAAPTTPQRSPADGEPGRSAPPGRPGS